MFELIDAVMSYTENKEGYIRAEIRVVSGVIDGVLMYNQLSDEYKIIRSIKNLESLDWD